MKNSKENIKRIKLPFKASVIFFTVIIVFFFLYKHPLFRPIFYFKTTQSWGDFTQNFNENSKNEAQKIWNFRASYDKGTVYLSKNIELLVPSEITSKYLFSADFKPHTVFLSGKLQSIEGNVLESTPVFLTPEQIHELGAEERIKTNQTQVLYFSKTQQAMIISQFSINLASTANGYLYLDLKNSDLKQLYDNQKWIVVTILEIN